MKIDGKNTGGDPDVVLIGAGIMSATLGMMLRQLQPDWKIEIYERLDVAAAESSDAWNNAGTGHSAFCELNYTPQEADGSIDTTKAEKIAESFEESRQFWSYLVSRKLVKLPESFIVQIPHMSFVRGEKNVKFLRARFEALTRCHLFEGMQYTENPNEMLLWMPLMMEGRQSGEKLAATRMDIGTDVNFGALTRSMFTYLREQEGVQLHFNHDVLNLRQERDGRWMIRVRDRSGRSRRRIRTRFVFIGAGGGSLPLLLKSGIEEGKGFGGFPVSGQWLRCKNRDMVERHAAKVYGKASVGSPPMSVPHLDTRMIKGQKELLFGPFAGFTTKFLKNGSILDLLRSIKLSNIKPMLVAGFNNIPLTRYLIDQVRQSPQDRVDSLREFVPNARVEDWELEIAGQRVQVIKDDPIHGGVLEFGTEVVNAADGSLAALLGASPGASTAVSIMISLLKKCFPNEMNSTEWKHKLVEMIPSYGQSLGEDRDLCRQVRDLTARTLKLGNSVPETSSAKVRT